jgi:AGCS family alanine or glycine:cation symporter
MSYRMLAGLAAASLAVTPALAQAPEPAPPPAGLDQTINALITPVADALSAVIFFSVPVAGAELPLIVVWLIAAATFFTVYLGFINFRGFFHAIRLAKGDYADPNDAGEVSHFQALATALSGTVGLGNIAGVGVAIALGGPGATFWMILAGLIGMSSKFAECTLAVKYRNEYPDGTISGGPMYYLKKGLAERGRTGLGRFLGAAFAICCVFGSFGAGNMFQANQSYLQFVTITGGEASWLADKAWLYGVILAVLVAIVIIGGIRSIARVTDKLVPAMAVLYVSAALVIIVANLGAVPGAIAAIIQGAFAPEGVAGGFLGVLINGFRRATFSNEAGVGSAPIAHSAVRTKEPVTEGFVALLEPFIDTVVICTMTALVVVITGAYTQPGLSGVEITNRAFGGQFAWFPYILTLAVFLFAYSTLISWSYYGLKAWTYLVGEGTAKELVYKAIFCTFIVIGASLQLGAVIDFSDGMFFTMALINIIGLYIMAPVVKRECQSYWQRLQRGEIRPYHARGRALA